jgi:hypothetical protein
VAVPRASLDHALVGEEDDRPLVDRRDRLHRRDVDELAAPGGFAGAHRRHHRDRRVEADHVAGDRGARPQGLALWVAGDEGVAAAGEVDQHVGALGQHVDRRAVVRIDDDAPLERVQVLEERADLAAVGGRQQWRGPPHRVALRRLEH